MIRLKALKPLRYSTRRLLPGDEFEAKPRDVRVLLATKKVSQVREPAAVPAPSPAVAAKIAAAVAPVAPVTPPAPVAVGAMTTAQMGAPLEATLVQATDDRAALRAEYEKTIGKAPFPGWSVDVLREKIAAAKAAS